MAHRTTSQRQDSSLARKEVSRPIDLKGDEKLIAPVIAHKLWGKSGPEGLSGGQRRQVAEFAHAIIQTLQHAGRIHAPSPKVFAFSIGDDVVHTGIVDGPNTGRVVALEFQGKPSVVVEFPPWPTSKSQKPWRGAYDERWLEQYPDRLSRRERARKEKE